MSAEVQSGAYSGGSFSQTLSRGLRVLETLAAAGRPMTAAEIAAMLALHRSIVYRCLRTLAEHGLVSVQADGRYGLGLKLVTLAQGVEPDARRVALPVLSDLSNEVGATALFALAEGPEVVSLLSVEPQRSTLHLAFRPGIRAPLVAGAFGTAILAGRPPLRGERPAVTLARSRGWASSTCEQKRGAAAVAAPVRVPGRVTDSSVGVVFLEGALDAESVASSVVRAARRISGALF